MKEIESMTREERIQFEEFILIMTAIAEEYGEEMSERRHLLRWQALKQYGIIRIRDATSEHLSKSNFFPRIHDLVDLIEGTGRDELTEGGALAWDEFIRAMEGVGRYNSVRFLNRRINAIVQEWGGWERVCTLEYDELKFKRKEFIELYKAFTRRDSETLPERCAGLIEGHNQGREDRLIETPPDKIVGRVGAMIEIQEGESPVLIRVDLAKEGSEKTVQVPVRELLSKIGRTKK